MSCQPGMHPGDGELIVVPVAPMQLGAARMLARQGEECVERDANVIGPMISKLRYQRGWRQDDLVAKLQLLGCSITRDVLANIETRRSPVNDRQIEFFCRVFGVTVQELFPHRSGPHAAHAHVIGLVTETVSRHRGQSPEDPAPGL